MRVALQLLAGAAACAAFILPARRLAPRGELRLYALGLAVAALVYVGFVALAALAGLRFSHLILAAGWAAHALWDVLLHGSSDAAFVPDWYPAVCAGFDLLLAGYIAARFARKVLR